MDQQDGRGYLDEVQGDPEPLLSQLADSDGVVRGVRVA